MVIKVVKPAITSVLTVVWFSFSLKNFSINLLSFSGFETRPLGDKIYRIYYTMPCWEKLLLHSFLPKIIRLLTAKEGFGIIGKIESHPRNPVRKRAFAAEK